MKTLLINLTLVTLVLSSIGCNSVNGKESDSKATVKESEKVEVYYFHYTRRCATCIAVEDETKNALNNLYGEQMKNKSIVFQSVNLDEDNSKELAEKLEISGQTLLIVSGEKKENLTTDAFMNAKSDPDKLKEIIKSTIDPLLGL